MRSPMPNTPRLARLAVDAAEQARANKLAELTWKHAGDENKAKRELAQEDAKLAEEKQRLERAEALVKEAGKGGTAGALAAAVAARNANAEAIAGTK